MIENENLKKSYDDLYIEIEKLKNLVILNNDTKNYSSLKDATEIKKTSGLFKKSTTLKK